LEEAALEKLLSVRQAADALGTPECFVRRLVYERRIPYHKVGRHVRIAEADLIAFVASGRVSPEAA
jgi:excisionase family DNA binding protein